jgi:predicted outer membrane repeat protein
VISALDTVQITGDDLQFYNNHALYGGCLYLLIECDVNFNQIHARNNSAELQGGFVRAAGLVVFGIRNGLLEDHRAEYGGVADISSKGVELNLTNSIVANNEAELYGGFVSISDGASLYLRDCRVAHNRAIFGGGIYVTNGYASILNSLFETNEASDSGGVAKIYSGSLDVHNSSFLLNTARDSGGVFHSERSTNLSISSSTLSENSALENGGVFYASDDTSLTSISNTFNRNGASLGGLLYSEKGGALNFYSCSSSNNSATTGGGSVYARTNFNLSIQDTTFISDSAMDIAYGGAIHLYNPLEILLVNNTFRSCRGGSGAALAIQGSTTLVGVGGGHVTISDSIFEDNQFSSSSLNSTTRYSRCMDGTIGNGGAISLIDTVPYVQISASTFTKNIGCRGGALFVSGGSAVVANSSFVENFAFIGGGGMFWQMPSLTPLITTASVIGTNNQAKYGSLIATDKSTLSVTHDNSLESSGHEFDSPVTVYVQVRPSLHHSLLS